MLEFCGFLMTGEVPSIPSCHDPVSGILNHQLDRGGQPSLPLDARSVSCFSLGGRRSINAEASIQEACLQGRGEGMMCGWLALF